VCSSAAWNGVSLDLASYDSLFNQNSVKLRLSVIVQNRVNRLTPFYAFTGGFIPAVCCSLRTRPHTITQNNPGLPLTIVS
jgi:hypothetical protein